MSTLAIEYSPLFGRLLRIKETTGLEVTIFHNGRCYVAGPPIGIGGCQPQCGVALLRVCSPNPEHDAVPREGMEQFVIRMFETWATVSRMEIGEDEPREIEIDCITPLEDTGMFDDEIHEVLDILAQKVTTLHDMNIFSSNMKTFNNLA